MEVTLHHTIHPGDRPIGLRSGRPGNRSRLRTTIAAALALMLTAVALAFGPAPAAAGENDEWAEEITLRYSDDDGDFGDLPMPNCGSKNITGDFRVAWWSIRTSLAPGIVLAGTEWDIEVRMHSAWSSGGNDGPDPLVVKLPALGGVERVGPVTATYGDADLLPYDAHFGPGSTGPIYAIGEYGYAFDANSSPGFGDGSDGVNLTMRYRVRAVGPGQVKIDTLQVSGNDATPPAGDVACTVPVNWTWGVLPAGKPVVAGEIAKVDARYFGTNPGDRNGGDHQIAIAVLANDDDPNIVGGPGSTAQVRLADWPLDSVQGGVVSCDARDAWEIDAATDEWETLPDGPCIYTPPQDFSGVDSFTYHVVQKTGRLTRPATVNIQVVKNDRPIASPVEFVVGQNTDDDFSLQGVVGDLNAGDTVFCVSELTEAVSPAVGAVTLGSDCKFAWDNQDPGFTGAVTFGYRACDIHPTQKSKGSLGTGVSPSPSYHLGFPHDLDANHTQLCQDATATIVVTQGGVFPPMAMSDFDFVDAGYPGDGVGPYTLDLDVLANDWDPNGPVDAASVALAILDGPDPAQGTATVINQRIRFTPTDGFSGLVSFTYRVCENPDLQSPPYEGLPFCGAGTVNLDVIGNEAPTVEPAVIDVEDGTTVSVDLNSFATDPEDEGISCSDLVGDPEQIASINWTGPCKADIELEPGHHGETLPLTFTVCDKHLLAYPKAPASPYGADGREDGDMAPRCNQGTIDMSVLAAPVDPGPQDPEPEVPEVPGPQLPDPEVPEVPQDPAPNDPEGDPEGEGPEGEIPAGEGAGDGGGNPESGALAGGADSAAVGGAGVQSDGNALLPRTGFSIFLPLAVGLALILGGSTLLGVRRRTS